MLKPKKGPSVGAGGAFQEALVGGAHDMLGAFVRGESVLSGFTRSMQRVVIGVTLDRTMAALKEGRHIVITIDGETVFDSKASSPDPAGWK